MLAHNYCQTSGRSFKARFVTCVLIKRTMALENHVLILESMPLI